MRISDWSSDVCSSDLDGIVLAEAQLLGLVARILLGDIVEARVRGADELDLDGGRLGHDLLPVYVKSAVCVQSQNRRTCVRRSSPAARMLHMGRGSHPSGGAWPSRRRRGPAHPAPLP